MFYSRDRQGFSLVEAVFALFILGMAALGLIRSLINMQFTAEDNLYEATALTVALSTVEQMKGASLTDLSNPPKVGGQEVFYLIAGNGTETALVLNDTNIVEIPLKTDTDGTVQKILPLTLTPSITENSAGTAYWLEVEYEYDHPRDDRTRTQVIRNMRSTISVY